MSTRRRCREVVLQILYEDDLNPERNLKNSEQFLVSRLKGNRPLIEFANGLLRGVRQYRRDIDKQLSEKATNWSLRRMAAIDRNVLRLASFEILFGNTPGRVAINEAVELAKRFGDKQSGQFVNGVLDRLLHDQQATLAPEHSPPERSPSTTT
ncbi:MAG: transcription antitermination factor NusB [Pirellulaceae bacterium]|nr:transcription antitermination factor NusB [Pirellulaceae bacterium]